MDLILNKALYNLPVATLGPQGTDAEAIAKKLTDHVILRKSFESAMEYAGQYNVTALVCCGYKKKLDGYVVESWVDLHFKYANRLHITEVFNAPTKPMCLAVRREASHTTSVVIHPSTEAFLEKLHPYIGTYKIHYVNNKPEAVQLVASGIYDCCIGSVDVVNTYDNLEIKEIFYPEMVWVLYNKIV